MSRQYLTHEIRDNFLEHIRFMVKYWEAESRAITSKDKLEGLAHSILCAIDGCTMALPPFILAPLPSPEDKQFHIDNGENYYPENHDIIVNADIAGSLHELFFKSK